MEVDIVLPIHVEKEGMDATGKYLVPMSYAVVAGKSRRIVYPIVQVPLVAARITQKRALHQKRTTKCRIAMITRVMMTLWMIGMGTCQTEAMRKIIGKIGRMCVAEK